MGRGKDKEPLAKKLGAHHYIDSGSRRCGGGIAKARRRARDPRNGTERRGDFRAAPLADGIVVRTVLCRRQPRLTNH